MNVLVKLVSLLVALTLCTSLEYPNNVQGTPAVSCGQGVVTFSLNTQNGDSPSRIFAKGFYDEKGCFVQNGKKATFNLSGCNMNRKRQIEPRGVQYELVVVVQMHPMFITKVDRAYAIKCFYMEADKLVTSGFEVNTLATEVVESGHAMPQCTYTLHKDTADGPLIRFSEVGDQIVHVWECPSDVYGMLVHSCYVSDNQGKDILVIDENGCAQDDFVMQTPVYSNQYTKAHQHTFVFKFADRMAVSFRCQIKLCFMSGEACQGITPPSCGGSTSERIIDTAPTTRSIVLNDDVQTKDYGQTQRIYNEPLTRPPPTTPQTQPSTSQFPTPSLITLKRGSTTSRPSTTELDLGSDELLELTLKPLNNPPKQNTINQDVLKIIRSEKTNRTESEIESAEQEVEGSGEAESKQNEAIARSRPALLENPALGRTLHFGRRLADHVADLLETDVNQEMVVLDKQTAQFIPDYAAQTDARQQRSHSINSEWEPSSASNRSKQEQNGICVSSLSFALVTVAFVLALVFAALIVLFLLRWRPANQHKRVLAMSRWSEPTNAF